MTTKWLTGTLPKPRQSMSSGSSTAGASRYKWCHRSIALPHPCTCVHTAVTIIRYVALLNMQKSVGVSEPCRFMADWPKEKKASCMVDIATHTTHLAVGALAALVRIGKVGMHCNSTRTCASDPVVVALLAVISSVLVNVPGSYLYHAVA